MIKEEYNSNESSQKDEGENIMAGDGSSTPEKTIVVNENDHDEDAKKGENDIGNYSDDGGYEVSQMNERMAVAKENKTAGKYQISQMEIGITDSDLPYDVPDDQTPLMSDMPKNYEQYSQKQAPDQTKN